MSDDKEARGQQPAASWDISRRRFVHGSAAVVGAAALLGRAAQGSPPRGRVAPRRRPVALDQAGGFTLRHASAPQQGSGSVTLALPMAASKQGTLLVATLLSTDGTAFAAPSGTLWQRAKEVTCANGRLEQWYWANNPGGQCGPGAGAVFTAGATATCLGGIAEFISPPNTTQILDTVGKNFGSGATQQVNAAGGAFAGTLAVFSQAEIFNGNVQPGNTWTQPGGYTDIADQDTGANVWSHSFDGDLTFPGGLLSGNPSALGGFSDTTDQSKGWGAALCCYRAVTVAPIGVVGGEVTNCLDLDPTGQMLVVGGDVEGCWRSANHGDNWQPANYGGIVPSTNPVQTVMADADEISFADIKWSQLQAGAIYACVGKTGSGYGAFLISGDGGCTWSQLNNPQGLPLQFYGNGTPPPILPSGVNQDADRTVNRLIAQDSTNGYLYVVTANQGVVRSPGGVNWTAIGLDSSSNIYPRCIVINPDNLAELWVGAWVTYNPDGTSQKNGGVYHTTNALDLQPTWTQLTGYTGTVADLKLVSSSTATYLFAACAEKGIYYVQTAGGTYTGNLASLNGTGNVFGGTGMDAIDNTGTSIWTSLDGYVDSAGKYQIIAGCSGGVLATSNGNTDPNYTNIVRLTWDGATTPTYQDLTGPTNNITIATLPPFGTAWWHDPPPPAPPTTWALWLGGGSSCNPHILIDPSNRQNIYVTGGGGFFRSMTGGTSWELAVTGMPMIGMHCFAIDPTDNTGTHFVHAGDDYTSIDVTDPTGSNPSAIVSTDPGHTVVKESGDGNHRESHAVCFDPNGNIYIGLNTAYSKPNGGGVVWRAPGPAVDASWNTLGFENMSKWTSISATPAVIGLFAGLDDKSNLYVIAVAQGAGTYRWQAATGWNPCGGSPLPGALSATVGQHAPIVAGNTDGYLFCYDRVQGLFRSSNHGKDWTQIWSTTTADARTGWLAVGPGTGGELWVTTDSGSNQNGGGLWHLTNANGSVNPQPVGGVFGAGAAGVAYGPLGDLYAIALPGTADSAPPVTTLYRLPPNGSVWADFCGGDGSVASYGPPAGQLGISSAGLLWVTGGEHFGFWAQVPTLTA